MAPPSRSTATRKIPKKFLGVRFVNCHCYGRLYINKAGDAYSGNCPKCYTAYRIGIAEGGTNSRMFLAYCP